MAGATSRKLELGGQSRSGSRRPRAEPPRSDLLFQDQLTGVLRADDLAILAAILIALDLRFVGAVGLL
jgi:hypothetical protein